MSSKRALQWLPLASLLLALSASAQSNTYLPSIELERLELNPDGMGSVFFGTGVTLPQGRYRFLAAYGFQKDPLVVLQNDQQVGRLIGTRSTLHLAGTYGFTDWLEAGVALPVVLYQGGDDLTSSGLTRPAATALGTPQITAKLGILSERRNAPIDLGLELNLGLPIGSVNALTRDASVRLAPKLTFGVDMGILRLGIQAGALIRPTQSILSPQALVVDDQVGNELEGAVSLSTQNKGVTAELALRLTKALTQCPNGAEALLALRYTGNWAVPFLFGALGFGNEPATPLFRLGAGVALGDTEPEKPAPPPPPPPAPLPPPAPAPVVEAPPPPPPNPCVAGQPHDAAQCPELDLDGDGIANGQDKCPNQPGVAPDGCPPPPPPPKVVVEGKRLVLTEKIRFKVNSPELDPTSNALLDEIAKALVDHPEAAHVRIEGHTDSSGKAAANKKLSQARADSVRAYLTRHGVAADRLTSKGMGSSKPLVSNDTPENREVNRRVEFVIEDR